MQMFSAWFANDGFTSVPNSTSPGAWRQLAAKCWNKKISKCYYASQNGDCGREGACAQCGVCGWSYFRLYHSKCLAVWHRIKGETYFISNWYMYSSPYETLLITRKKHNQTWQTNNELMNDTIDKAIFIVAPNDSTNVKNKLNKSHLTRRQSR